MALTTFWCGMLLLYAVSFFKHNGQHSHRSLVWIFLAITQLAMAWTYVEISDNAIVSQFVFFKRSTPLNQLRYAGTPRSKSRWLAKSFEIETMSDPPTYIAVEEQDAFLQALQDRGYSAQPMRYPTSPLGLSL